MQAQDNVGLTASDDQRSQRLLTLLQLERDIRQAEDRNQLGFMLVNDTHRLLPYDQAVFFTWGSMGQVQIRTISAIAHVDQQAPFVIWLRQALKSLQSSANARECHSPLPEQLPGTLAQQWSEWQQGQVCYCPLLSTSGVLLGGLWLSRSQPWHRSEQLLLTRLAEAYAYSWQALAPRSSGWLAGLRSRPALGLALVGLLGLGLIPVSQTVLAPAQVVAYQPLVVSSPINGVVDEILVQPNQPVAAGDVLFQLEDTSIRSQYEVAKKSLAVAEANYLQASQKAFVDLRSKGELAVLQAVREEKQAELHYQAELLARTQVTAEQDGVAIFANANDWLGRPVVVGEKVMTLADIHDTWLEIWLPVDDAIVLEPGVEATLFLNIAPLAPLQAVLAQTSYEASLSPQDILAYRLTATFSGDKPRLGLKGTAKIYGPEVSLGYYLLRRPLAAVRRWLGW